MGGLQSHIAKRVDTVKGDELGPFCNLSTMPQCADGADVSQVSYLVSTLLNFGLRVVRSRMWNIGKDRTGLYFLNSII